MQDRGGVERPQVRLIFGQNGGENVQRQLSSPSCWRFRVAMAKFTRALQPAWRTSRNSREDLFRSGVFVAPHQRHATIVLGDQALVDGWLIGSAARGEHDSDNAEQQQPYD